MIVVLLCQESKLHAARLSRRLTISIRADAGLLAMKIPVLPSLLLLQGAAVFCASLAWTRERSRIVWRRGWSSQRLYAVEGFAGSMKAVRDGCKRWALAMARRTALSMDMSLPSSSRLQYENPPQTRAQQSNE